MSGAATVLLWTLDWSGSEVELSHVLDIAQDISQSGALFQSYPFTCTRPAGAWCEHVSG